MRISRRASSIPASETLALAARAKALKAQGRSIVDFSVGEPDFITPEAALKAAHAALDQGDTHYPPNVGSAELRAAVVKRVERDFGYKADPARVIVSNGAKQTLFNLVEAIVDEGDEVVIASPYWVSYPAMVALAGGVTKYVPTRPDEGFRLEPSNLERALTARTKLIIINSPQNPTGAVYARDDVHAIVKLALDRKILLISDEIYSYLVYEDWKHHSVLEVKDPRLEDGVIFVSGVSKTFAMTGFRIGYAIGPKDVVDAASRFQSHATSGAASVSQRAAAIALTECDEPAELMRQEFAERRRIAVERLRAIPGLRVPEPRGAFYVFPDFSSYYGKKLDGEAIAGSTDLSRILLEKAGVALVPGAAFGADAHLRLSYALDKKDLESGISRLAQALAQVKP